MIESTAVNMIECGVWDELVEETYGRPYNFQQQDECQARGVHNLTIPRTEEEVRAYYDYHRDEIPYEVNGDVMGVSFEAWKNADPAVIKEKLSDEDRPYDYMFWERNFYPSVESVAYDLNQRGLLPEGNIAIKIDW